LFETPKEIGNKLLDKMNWRIREIKMQRIKMWQKIVFYSKPFINLTIYDLLIDGL